MALIIIGPALGAGCATPESANGGVRLAKLNSYYAIFSVEGPSAVKAGLTVSPQGATWSRIWTVDVSADGDWTVGFLEAETEYRIQIELYDRDSQRIATSTHIIRTPSSMVRSEPMHVLEPGSEIQGGSCRAGFIVRDAANESLFFLTARHCVGDIGATVFGDGGSRIGSVAWVSGTEADWAIVRIDPTLRTNVSIALPSGILSRSFGDPPMRGEDGGICIETVDSLNGRPLRACGEIVDNRTVFKDGLTVELFAFNVTVKAGQSGAPVIDERSHQALGTLIGRSGDGKVAWAVWLKHIEPSSQAEDQRYALPGWLS